MTKEEYIHSVLERMPRTAPMREQIAMELRGHIAERMEQGQSQEEAIRQLGDPEKLAGSYMAAEPLVSVGAGDRIAAKLIDFLAVLVALIPVFALCWWLAPPSIPRFTVLCVVALAGGTIFLGLYTIVAESSSDQTLGKRMLRICVVCESGIRISVGQAIVRQLPIFLSVIWIDAMFALFTERRQRAFELLSRTRVVAATPAPSGNPGLQNV